MTTSGVTVLSGNYDAAVAPPSISGIGNAADGSRARGSRRTGQHLRREHVRQQCGHFANAFAHRPRPVLPGSQWHSSPAALRFQYPGKCPVAFPPQRGRHDVDPHPRRRERQLNFNVSSTAPSVFTSGSVGPETGLATIVRADNNQLVTPTNPLHTNDTMIIYLTGLGATSPAVDDGMPAPSSPLASAMSDPRRHPGRRSPGCAVCRTGSGLCRGLSDQRLGSVRRPARDAGSASGQAGRKFNLPECTGSEVTALLSSICTTILKQPASILDHPAWISSAPAAADRPPVLPRPGCGTGWPACCGGQPQLTVFLE